MTEPSWFRVGKPLVKLLAQPQAEERYERRTDWEAGRSIRTNGFVGVRFGQVRAWVVTEARRSVPHWRQR